MSPRDSQNERSSRENPTARPRETVLNRQLPRRFVWAAFLVTVALALVLGFAFFQSRHPYEGSKATNRSVRTVAVIDVYDSVTGTADVPFSSVLVHGIVAALEQDSTLRVLDDDHLMRVKSVVSVADLRRFSKEALGQLRKQTGTEVIVGGSFSSRPSARSGLRLDMRIHDAVSGETKNLIEYGTQSDVEDLVSRVAARIRLELDVTADSRTNPASANLDVTQRCAQAEARLREWDAGEAQRLLEPALVAEPGYGPIHSASSAAWRKLGWDERSRDAARKAVELSIGLASREKLLAQARYAEAYGDWPAACAAYERLRKLHPDDQEFGFLLAEAQLRAGDAEAFAQTLDLIEHSAGSESPRLLLLRAIAAKADPLRMDRLAVTARASAVRHHLPFVAAEAAIMEAYALRAFGPRQKRFDGAIEYAQSIYRAASDRLNLSTVTLRAGAPRRIAEETERLVVEAGNDRGQVLVLYRRAEFHHLRSQLGLARTALDEADELLERWEGLRNEPLAIAVRGLTPSSFRAWLDYDRGDVKAARSLLEPLSTSVSPDVVPLGHVFPYVLVLCEQGEVHRARRVAESAISRARAVGDRLHEAYATYALGRVAHVEGRLDEALRLYEQCVVDLKALALNIRLWELAVLRADRGELSLADQSARSVQQGYARGKIGDREMAAVGVRLRVLLARGDLAEAKQVGDRERMLATGTESTRLRLRARVELALLDAALGNVRQALGQLEDVVSEARRRGLVQTEMEARAALCDLTSDRVTEACTRLHADAEEKGFGLIAKTVARIRSQVPQGQDRSLTQRGQTR
jgi:tetratricopeptide (TPR) repeat protein